MKIVKTLIATFANPISYQEIVQFRGAVIHSLEENNILFHNHTNDGFRYSYPLIQYKRIKGNAAIVCVNEGTEAIGQLFSNSHFKYFIGDKKIDFEIADIKAYQTTVGCEDTTFRYHLSNWLPLNANNYELYKSTESLATHVEILEKVLIGNMMSFLKGVNIFIEEQVKLSITSIKRMKVIRFKGVALTSFDIDFMCNLRLPPYIGIGKGASTGFGLLHINNRNNSLQHE